MSRFLKATLFAGAVALVAAPNALAYGSKSKSTETAAATSEMKSKTIVDVAAGAGTFNTLIAAAKAAGLAEALSGEGPLTVFAPTDAAFAALPEGTVETLLLPENKDQLAGILKYHVIAGKIKSSDLAGAVTTTDTLNGEITVDATGETVKVAGATVTTADVMADNGVIHIIDAVMLPPQTS